MTLKSTETELDYMGYNSKGHGIRINANKEGISPMENILISVAACSCVDIEILLKKMRNELQSLEVQITGEREEDATPKPYTAIHLKYFLHGKVKEKSAEKAIGMAVDKYCSVSACLDPNIKISYTYEILDK